MWLLDFPACDRLRHRGPSLSFRADGARRARGRRTSRRLPTLHHPQSVQRDCIGRSFWPLEGWARSRARVRERYDARVLVSGSPADARWTEGHRSSPRWSGRESIRLRGARAWGAFGALARRARAFVGITTGSMHVAAAVGCPTVGIFPFQFRFSRTMGTAGRANGGRAGLVSLPPRRYEGTLSRLRLHPRTSIVPESSPSSTR